MEYFHLSLPIVSLLVQTISAQQRLGNLTVEVGLGASLNLFCSFANVPSVKTLKLCSNLLELKKFGELLGEITYGFPKTGSFLIDL